MDAGIVEGLALAMTGLVAGILGGLLGIGGSIVMIPVMTELFGPQQHLYQAAALLVNFFVALPAVRQHLRAGAVCGSMLWRLIPAAVVGSVLGVALSELPIFHGAGVVYLTGLFGLFLFYVAGYDALRLFRGTGRPDGDPGPVRRLGKIAIVLLVGLPTGIVSGLLGVGGGIVAVPLQRRILGLSLRMAIANSASMIIALSLVGAAIKHIALGAYHPEHRLYEPLALAVFLIPTAVVGGSIGGRLTHTLPLRWVHVAFILLMLVAGLRMASRALGPPQAEHAAAFLHRADLAPRSVLQSSRSFLPTNPLEILGPSRPIGRADHDRTV